MRWFSAWGPVLAFEAAVLFASSRPHLRPPQLWPHLDKGAHFVEYSILGALLFRAFRLSGGSRREATLLSIALAAALAAGDEWLQSHVPGRTASLFDGLADLAGLLTGVLIARRFVKSREPDLLTRNPH